MESIDKIKHLNSTVFKVKNYADLASELQAFQRDLTNTDYKQKVEEIIKMILSLIIEETQELEKNRSINFSH